MADAPIHSCRVCLQNTRDSLVVDQRPYHTPLRPDKSTYTHGIISTIEVDG